MHRFGSHVFHDVAWPLLLSSPPPLVRLQTSPLGEFASRLALLEAFQRQTAAAAADSDATAGGAATAARQRQLSALLHNVTRYYAQFDGAVQRQIDAGMAELEKALADFVALAKWEDRGYYALRWAGGMDGWSGRMEWVFGACVGAGVWEG
jgi:hypothetical protein